MESLLRRSALDSHLLPPEDSVHGLSRIVYTPRNANEALRDIKAGRKEVPYLAVDRAARNLRKEIFASSPSMRRCPGWPVYSNWLASQSF
jgi:hypothetical protein